MAITLSDEVRALLDDPNFAHRSINILLGTSQELPTKSSTRDRLRQKIEEMTKRGVDHPAASGSVSFAELVERWEKSEGPGMGDTTRDHYTNALRAYVLPQWKNRRIERIQREDVTKLLNSQAARYSRSSLRSMRVVICLTLKWAERNGYITRPTGWLEGIKLPRKTWWT